MYTCVKEYSRYMVGYLLLDQFQWVHKLICKLILSFYQHKNKLQVQTIYEKIPFAQLSLIQPNEPTSQQPFF